MSEPEVVEKVLKILQTPCGPVAMSCATCLHSAFVRGNIHTCALADDEQVDEDDDCSRWQPLVVAGTACFFGVEHGGTEEV